MIGEEVGEVLVGVNAVALVEIVNRIDVAKNIETELDRVAMMRPHRGVANLRFLLVGIRSAE